MAKGSAKKSFLDLFKITDSNDDDFDVDIDLSRPKGDNSWSSKNMTRNGILLIVDCDQLEDDGSYAASDRAKASPLKSFNKYKNSRTPSGNVSKTKTAKSSQNSKLVSINSRSDRDSYDDSEVFVIKPDEFDDAQMIIDHLNRGQIIVINMEDLDLPTAQRIADFIGGASYAVNGLFQAISGNIFLATPNGTYVSGDLREELAGGSLGGEDLSKATY